MYNYALCTDDEDVFIILMTQNHYPASQANNRSLNIETLSDFQLLNEGPKRPILVLRF